MLVAEQPSTWWESAGLGQDKQVSDTPLARTALVTGAGSGIGRAAAVRLARDGFAVAAADRDAAGGLRTAELATAESLAVRAFRVDVTSQESVQDLRAVVSYELGAPAVLVLCAGWDEIRPFAETDPGFWSRVVEINYLGVVRVVHAFLPDVLAAGAAGRVVTIASDAGRVGSTGEAVYAGAKGGVIAFTKSLAREVARAGVTANVVCPGPTDTPLLAAQPAGVREALTRSIPMRRVAAPEEVAHAISFFAGAAAGYITGQVLSVSGGLTMHG